MDTKTITVCSCACIAILIGGYMTLRTLGTSGPTTKNIESVMHGLSTDELINRRYFMAQQVEQAQANSSGDKHPMLISAEKSLEELDLVLANRGVDPHSLPELSNHEINGSVRSSSP